MEKLFKGFFLWENQPSTKTPLGARLLNMINNVINALDDRLLQLNAVKLDINTANEMVKDVAFEENTGIITITKLDGTVVTIDTKLEKIAVNFTWDATTQKLVLHLDDGSIMEVDLSALITIQEFLNSETIAFAVGADGKISAVVKNGSITEEKLQPNYLADIKVESAKATVQAEASAQQALLSKSYAIGGSGVREDENEDNSKYYAEQAKNYMEAAQAVTNLVVPEFYIDFTTGCLMSRTKAKGITFTLEDGYFLGKLV